MDWLELLDPPVRKVWQKLMAQGYTVGQKLPPSEKLADALEVSRSSLREVMAVLEHLGLIRQKRKIGTYLIRLVPDGQTYLENHFQLIIGMGFMARRETTEEQQRQTATARLILEPVAAVHLARIWPPPDRQRLTMEMSIIDQADAIRDNDLKAFCQADQVFHQAIFDGSDNPILTVMGRLLIKLAPHTDLAPKRLQTFLGEHREILLALQAQNEEAVHRAMSGHLQAL